MRTRIVTGLAICAVLVAGCSNQAHAPRHLASRHRVPAVTRRAVTHADQ